MNFILKNFSDCFQSILTWSQEHVDPGAWQSQLEPAQHWFVSRLAHRPTSIGPCIRPERPFKSFATSRKRSSNRPRDGSPPGRVNAWTGSDSPAVRHSVLNNLLTKNIQTASPFVIKMLYQKFPGNLLWSNSIFSVDVY